VLTKSETLTLKMHPLKGNGERLWWPSSPNVSNQTAAWQRLVNSIATVDECAKFTSRLSFSQGCGSGTQGSGSNQAKQLWVPVPQACFNQWLLTSCPF